MAYPDNVLHFATECGNKGHSAAFPKALPDWFIRLFTKPGDWVLDPFAGSGTTCVAAKDAGRNSVGIDMLEEYCQIAKEAVMDIDPVLALNDKNGHYNTRKHSRLRGKAHPSVSRGAIGKFTEA
jgi:DNA modification methylase